MKDKIFSQVLDTILGVAPVAADDALELSLILLVWAKLSATGVALQPNPIDSCFPDTSDQFFKAFDKLAADVEKLQPVLVGIERFRRLPPGWYRPATELVSRLSNTGVLQSLDPSNAATLSATASEHFLPPELADLMVMLAQVKPNDTVYLPWDTGAQFSVRALRQQAETYIETPNHSTLPILIGLLAGGLQEVHYSDPIRSPTAISEGAPRKFDIAIAFPPMGLRYDSVTVKDDWFGRFPEKTQSGTVLAIRHLLAQATGAVVVAVPNTLLFSTGAELALRQSLVHGGLIHSVIALPSGILPTSNVSLALLVLDPMGNQESIRFINADSPHFRKSVSRARATLTSIDDLAAIVFGESVLPDSTAVFAEVSVEDVLANDAQLQVSRYVLPESTKKLQAMLAGATTVSLGDLVSTVRPLAATPATEDAFDVLEVGAIDLPPYGYISTPSRTTAVNPRLLSENERQFLRPHDIVLIVKGSVGKIGIVPADVPPPGPGGWIAGQSAIVLRPNKHMRITSSALFLQLRSPVGQALLSGIVSGAAIQLIQMRELTRLPILIPPTDIVDLADEALADESALQAEIDRLRAKQAEVTTNLWQLH